VTAKKQNKFDEFIEEQTKLGKIAEQDWAERLQDWQTHINHFYENVEVFLQPYLDKGKISIRYGRKKILEDVFGEYEVDTAAIQLGPNLIRLEPIGSIIIGAQGRLDMIGPNGVVKFLLVDKNASEPKILARVQILDRNSPVRTALREPKPEQIDWTWKIATDPPQIKFYPLTEESFFDALMGVTNG